MPIRWRNPYFAFTITTVASLLLYLLDWSELYPQLDWNLIAFLALILAIANIGSSLVPKAPSKMANLASLTPSRTEVISVSALWVASFIWNRGIPLLQVMRGDLSYGIYEFGLPLLHVPLLTFTIFVSLRAFLSWQSTRSRRDLALAILAPMACLLIYSRSALMTCLLAQAVGYLHVHRITWKRAVVILVASVTVIGGFGALGNARLPFQIEQDTGHVVSLDEAMGSFALPTYRFYASGLPLGVLWTYLYVSAPLGNLQLMLQTSSASRSYQDLIVSEFLPDVISKRLPYSVSADISDRGLRERYLVSPSLTVGTAYFSVYFYGGWIGAVMFTLLTVVLWYAIRSRIRRPEWALVGSCAFTAFLLLCLFANMWKYSAVSLIMLYPFIFNYLAQRRESDMKS